MPTYDENTRKRYFYLTQTTDEFGNDVARWMTRTNENDPKAVYNKDTGKYWHHHGAIGGIIIKIGMAKKTNKEGNVYWVWEIEMNGGDAIYVISFSLQSPSSNAIMFRLPNAKLDEEIKFIPYYFVDNGKTITVIVQKDPDGKWRKVEKYWNLIEDDKGNKSMTNNMPDLDAIVDPLTKAKTWDDRKQKAFMWAYFEANILPKIAMNSTETEIATQEDNVRPEHEEANTRETVENLTITEVEEIGEAEGEDDLPF